MDKQKFKDFIMEICRAEGGYVIPFLMLEKDSTGKNYGNWMVDEKTMDDFLEENYPVLKFSVVNLNQEPYAGGQNQAILGAFLKVILFDGKGYFVPCFGTYINKPAEKQHPNAKTADGIPYYDFAKDESFNKFLFDILSHMDNVAVFIGDFKARYEQKMKEFRHEANTTDMGLVQMTKELTPKVQEKRIEELKEEFKLN